jgi:hypothetical protein
VFSALSQGVRTAYSALILCTLHINLLVIYIAWIKSRSGIPYHLCAHTIGDSPSPPSSPPLGRKSSQSLENILRRLGPITDVHFDPFQPKPKQSARAILPPTFPLKPHPFDYFSLFFTPELFQTITTNTNRYASLQRLHIKGEWARE